MDSGKLEVNKTEKEPPSVTSYRQIPESDLEEEAVKDSNKSSVKQKNSKSDGAEEKMLPDQVVNANEIKFTTNEKQNGDAKLEIGDINSKFVGMGKEELMKYANDPFWIRLRWILFIGFWILWAAMLVGAVLIIVSAPKCYPPPPKTWWEKGPLVEVKEKISIDELQLLKTNKVQGIILSWFTLPDAYLFFNNTGEYLEILKMAKETNMNVIIDLNPLTTNLWLNLSEANDDYYKTYFIWANSKGQDENGKPIWPNNWKSKNGEPAWKYSIERQKFYYAPDSRPLLNFRNPYVVKEFTAILTKLLDEGVKGVRIHGAPSLLVDNTFADEDINSEPSNYTLNDYEFYKHTHTQYLSEIGTVLNEWKNVVKSKTENGPFMVADDLSTLEPFKFNQTLVIDLPKKTNFLKSSGPLTASALYGNISLTEKIFNNTWPLWEHNRTDLPLEVMNSFISLLKGTPLLYGNQSLPIGVLNIRESHPMMYGNFKSYKVANGTVFAVTRFSPSNPGYLVALNPTKDRVVVNFFSEIPGISDEINVKFKSSNFNETEIMEEKMIDSNSVAFSPSSLAVFTYILKTP